jgi:hypothetical protein
MVDSAGHPQPYFRVVDPVTHEVLSTSFGMGHVFGSAMVQPAADSMAGTDADTFWAWGVNGGYGPKITAFYSTDLITWKNGTAFEIKNRTEVGFGGMCNNAVTRLDTPPGTPPAYVMAIESNMGKEYLQATFAYLNSSNLSQGWTQFDPKTYHYTDREYSACPTIRHFAGWFYVASLFSPCCGNAPRYQQVLVRSRDLKTWATCVHSFANVSQSICTACNIEFCHNAPYLFELTIHLFNDGWDTLPRRPALPDVPAGPMNTTRPGWTRTGNGSKYNPILCPLFDEANDKRVGTTQWNYNTSTQLTAAQRENIAKATDFSNSDMDWSDDGKGGVYISYGWSNQASFSNMFLAAAEVRNATQQEWLESFFD